MNISSCWIWNRNRQHERKRSKGLPAMNNPPACATELIRIPPKFLEEIADESDRIPRLYYARNPLLRRMFWERLYVLNRMLNRHLESRENCLDFGGGSGVLLPTLAA